MAFNRTYNSGNVDTSNSRMVLPAGEYLVQIVKTTDKVSRNTGKDMIELEIEVAEGPHKGAKLWQYICDDQYADQRVYEIMTSCGKNVPQTINSTVFRGLTGRVKTKTREYNGETKSEISYWIRPKSGTAPAPAAPANESANSADGIPF